MKVAQELQEAYIPRQGGFADPPKHPHIGLQQRKEALRPVLVDVTARIFLLRMIDKVVHIARERPIAAGRVGVEPTARLHGEVRCLLHRLDSKVPRRVDDDTTLAADPGNDGGPIFVVVAAAGLALLASASRSAAQRLRAAPLRLPLVAGGVIEVIDKESCFQLPYSLSKDRDFPVYIGDGSHLGGSARGEQDMHGRITNPDHGALDAYPHIFESACALRCSTNTQGLPSHRLPITPSPNASWHVPGQYSHHRLEGT